MHRETLPAARGFDRVTLPRFDAGNDPGPGFVELLKATGNLVSVDPRTTVDVPHGTTCLAIKFVDGVLVAGDRRASGGGLVLYRETEKVVQADEFSGVAISGAAGPAVEMIKLFQTTLEHYEKMEGRPLTLEGKANQLSSMVRDNLPAAMQGLGVYPLFAGFEPRTSSGHIWDYDGTGGRYEEREYVTIGSGGTHAGTVIKIGWRSGLSRQDALRLACRALWEAADSDTATGGPDKLRGIYPRVATITSAGWTDVADQELADVFAAIEEEVRQR